MDIITISPQGLQKTTESQATPDVIDVRTPAEYREAHIPIATNVPLDQLDPQEYMQSRNGSREQPLYIICQSGTRAKTACQKFIEQGYENVVCVEGGTKAWIEAGLDAIRGKKTISIERQVRIGAGTLVLLGVILGFAVNPWFTLISGVVGAGLIHAGITDTCGMSVLFSKMPWNR